jgi:hypothetical protein
MTVAVALAVIAWGALAFGAVYPWAYTPLMAGCACVGALGLWRYRKVPFSHANRAWFVALLCVMAAVLAQLLPLPAVVLKTLSPSTDAFLQNYDITYALGASGDGHQVGSDAIAGPVRHPLSIAPRATVVGLAFLGAFTLFLAGLTRALSGSGARRLATLIVAFGVCLALVGIVQKVMLGDHAWGGMKIYGFWRPANLLSTPFGPYVNKNHFAGWMLMAVPLALGLALGMAEQGMRDQPPGWRSTVLWLSSPLGGRVQLILIAVLLMLASLLMTKSRSGVAALVIALVFVSIAAGRRFGSARVGLGALASLGVIFLGVFVMAGADFASRITSRLDAMELRKNIWSDSAAIIRAFPLTGTGVNTFGTAMINYQTSYSDQHFQEAHNDYLQVLVEGGLLVALPALVTLVLIARTIRRRFRDDGDAMTYWIRAGATIGLMAIALQAFVEFSLQMPGNAALSVALLAIALHEAPRKRSRAARGAAARRTTLDFRHGLLP